MLLQQGGRTQTLQECALLMALESITDHTSRVNWHRWLSNSSLRAGNHPNWNPSINRSSEFLSKRRCQICLFPRGGVNTDSRIQLAPSEFVFGSDPKETEYSRDTRSALLRRRILGDHLDTGHSSNTISLVLLALELARLCGYEGSLVWVRKTLQKPVSVV